MAFKGRYWICITNKIPFRFFFFEAIRKLSMKGLLSLKSSRNNDLLMLSILFTQNILMLKQNRVVYWSVITWNSHVSYRPSTVCRIERHTNGNLSQTINNVFQFILCKFNEFTRTQMNQQTFNTIWLEYIRIFGCSDLIRTWYIYLMTHFQRKTEPLAASLYI